MWGHTSKSTLVNPLLPASFWEYFRIPKKVFLKVLPFLEFTQVGSQTARALLALQFLWKPVLTCQVSLAPSSWKCRNGWSSGQLLEPLNPITSQPPTHPSTTFLLLFESNKGPKGWVGLWCIPLGRVQRPGGGLACWTGSAPKAEIVSATFVIGLAFWGSFAVGETLFYYLDWFLVKYVL